MRHGRLVAGARGHLRDRRGRPRRARLLPARHGPRPRSPTSSAPSSWCRASPGSHGRDRLASAGPSRPPSPRPGIDPTARIVIVTDPGSPLDEESRAGGYRVINADPERRRPLLGADRLRPGALGSGRRRHRGPARRRRGGRRRAQRRRRRQPRAAARRGHGGHRPAARQARPRRRRVRHRRVRRLGRAAHRREHRQAGHRRAARRRGRRLRPRGRLAGRRRHGRPPGQRLRRRPRRTRSAPDDAVDASRSEVAVSGPLGAQLLLWEVATAAAGRLLGINPFDQPDVESAKKAARALLDKGIGDGRGPRRHRRCGRDPRRSAATGSATRRTVDRCARRAVRPARRRARLRRRDGLPRPDHRRGPRRRAAGAGAAYRTSRRRSAGAPGSCTPPASSTRAGRPTGVYLQITDRTARGPRDPRPGVHLRRLHRLAGRR